MKCYTPEIIVSRVIRITTAYSCLRLQPHGLRERGKERKGGEREIEERGILTNIS